MMTNKEMEVILLPIAKNFFLNLDPAHDILHTRRVLKNAYKIGAAETANLRILTAASILHDIGRAQERRHDGIPHEIWGSQKCEKILMTYTDLSPDEIDHVKHCIIEHRSSSAEFTSLESRVLYDADKLDSVGIIGLCRTFTFSGLLHQPFYHDSLESFDDEEFYKERILDSTERDDYTAYEEFKRKLCRVKDAMQTKTGKSLARNRHSTMCHAIDLFRAEIRGEM